MSRGAEAGQQRISMSCRVLARPWTKNPFSTQLHSIEKPLVSWRSLRNLHATWIYMEGIARWSTQKWVQNERILSHAQAEPLPGENCPFGHWRWLVAGAMGRGMPWSHRVISN